VRAHVTSRPLVLLLLAVACAAKAPPPQAAVVATPPPPPDGSKRLPSSIACELGPSGEAAGPEIGGVLREHAAEMRACYDARLPTLPRTEGRVVARIAIDPSGSVETSCLVRSSMNDAAIDRCVVDHLLTLKFRAREAGGWVVVDHPFVFTR
jgi:hypothetical protein